MKVKDFARDGGSFLAILGFSIVLAACSSGAGRTPERDRSMDIRGAESEVAARPPRIDADAPREPGYIRRPELVRGQRAADVAMKYRGASYQWGGADPSGFDCSGFVRYVYAQVGVSLPHNAARQYEYGTPISRDRLEPGDLVFFDRLRHNGIYIGQGRFIHARQTGRRVNVGSLDEDWYRSHFVGARRL